MALLRCGAAGPALQWMLDLGLLEPLLPEAYAMVQASERGLGEFGQILPVVDRKVAAGREVSDGGLLAALLLPTVLLRRYDVEAVGQRALRRSELHALVREAAEAFFARYGISRERTRQTLEALDAFLRLCEPPASAAERVKVAARSSFPDALWLFELLAEATGEGFQELAQWQAAARRRPVLAAAGDAGPRSAAPRAPARWTAGARAVGAAVAALPDGARRRARVARRSARCPALAGRAPAEPG